MRPLAVALFSLSAMLTAQAQPPAGVREAQQEHDGALAKARAAYEEAVQKAAAGYKDKLAAIRDDLAKGGNLDAALAVRGLLKELDEVPPPLPGRTKDQIARDQFVAALSKVAWTAPKGWGLGKKSFVFGTDGYIHYVPGGKNATAWVALAPGVVVALPPNAAEMPVDVLTIDLEKGTATVRFAGWLKSSRPAWEANVVK